MMMMRWPMAMAAALMLTALPASAEPDPSIAQTPRHSASLEVMSLVGRGLAGQFERRLTGHLSLAANLGLRSRARGDYDSLALSTGGEARWWFNRRTPWSGLRAPAMVGFYMGARLDMTRTSTSESGSGDRIGSMLSITHDISAGFRFAFFRRLEITPSAGLGLRHEFDLEGRLPPWTRASLSFGLTIGALF